MSDHPVIHVAAGALINTAGEVLINERPDGKPMAGYWEFPGGKLEAGETAEAALIRELDEELGIQVLELKPLIQLQHAYPDKHVVLDVFKVPAWRGEVQGLEQQTLAWCNADQLTDYKLLPADGPIVHALQLPERYFITPECNDELALQEQLQLAAKAGCGIVQLRQKHWPTQRLLAALPDLQSRADELALALQVNGLSHFTAEQLMNLQERPGDRSGWVSASCHNAAELAKAEALGLDFVLLSPVQATQSHPDAAILGWAGFTELVSACNIPVYALGGLCANDLAQAQAAGAQGVAAISAWQSS